MYAILWLSAQQIHGLNTVGVQVEREEVPHYAEGSEYLKSLGFRNASEISRVLDIAMNPNSLYLQDRHKRRSVNSSVSDTGAIATALPCSSVEQVETMPLT